MAKQYNPWTGLLEDTTTKSNDVRTCDTISAESPESMVRKLKLRGYEVDPSSKSMKSKYITLYKNGREYDAEITHYSNGDLEIQEYNIHVVDSKPTIDKAIRVCDRGDEVDILFYVDIDGNKVHETFSSNAAMRSRLDELKRHGIKRFQAWSHAEWSKSESEFRRMFNKIKGSL
jgi:hypothetical protein